MSNNQITIKSVNIILGDKIIPKTLKKSNKNLNELYNMEVKSLNPTEEDKNKLDVLTSLWNDGTDNEKKALHSLTKKIIEKYSHSNNNITVGELIVNLENIEIFEDMLKEISKNIPSIY